MFVKWKTQFSPQPRHRNTRSSATQSSPSAGALLWDLEHTQGEVCGWGKPSAPGIPKIGSSIHPNELVVELVVHWNHPQLGDDLVG